MTPFRGQDNNVSGEPNTELQSAVQLTDGERIERVYVFDPVVRRETTFSLALVTKSMADEALEMVAIGERRPEAATRDLDFVRRARFPAERLPQILEEFIDRCGVEGAVYREFVIESDGTPEEQLAELHALLTPAAS